MDTQEPIDTFEGLDEVLGTNFVSSETVVEQLPEFVPDTENHPLAQDKLDLMNKLKELDHEAAQVVEYLKSEIKIGARTSYHSVYAQLVKARLEIYKELREMVFAYDEVQRSEKQPKNTNVELKASIPLSSTDLFALANSKKVAEAKKVDAEEMK